MRNDGGFFRRGAGIHRRSCFHHKNIQKKFDAPNKTLAAAYAAALGLI